MMLAQAPSGNHRAAGGRGGDQVEILGREAEQDLVQRDYVAAVESTSVWPRCNPIPQNVLNNLGLATIWPGGRVKLSESCKMLCG